MISDRASGRAAGSSPRRGVLRRAAANPSLLVGATAVAAIVTIAALSFVWTPYNPIQVDSTSRLQSPSPAHWFGTDKFGRDVLSQIMVGARTTLFVGLVSVGIAAMVGVPLGLLSAMLPRWAGRLVMRANDLLLAFPALLLAIILAAVFGASTLSAMVAIGIATVPAFARVTRSGALQVRTSEFVLAARSSGMSASAIAVRHVLPNVASLVIVQASVAFAIAVLAEAALSFLGFGTPAPTPSWGRMLQESQELVWVAPRLSLFPGAMIAVAVLGLNLFGDGLRDVLDPRLVDHDD